MRAARPKTKQIVRFITTSITFHTVTQFSHFHLKPCYGKKVFKDIFRPTFSCLL